MRYRNKYNFIATRSSERMSQIVIFKASLLFYTHSNTYASAFDVDREEIVSSSANVKQEGVNRILKCCEAF